MLTLLASCRTVAGKERKKNRPKFHYTSRNVNSVCDVVGMELWNFRPSVYIYWLGKAEEVYVKLKKMIAEGGRQEKPSLYLDGQLLEFLCCQGDLAHEVLGDHVLVEHILHKKTDRSAVNSITHTSDHHDAGCYHRHAAPKEVSDHQEHITTITGVISRTHYNKNRGHFFSSRGSKRLLQLALLVSQNSAGPFECTSGDFKYLVFTGMLCESYHWRV